MSVNLDGVSSGITVQNNDLRGGNLAAIGVSNCPDCVVSDNTVEAGTLIWNIAFSSYSYPGITGGVIFENNTVSGVRYGFHLGWWDEVETGYQYQTDNTVYRNNVITASDIGMAILDQATNNQIYNNTFNSSIGVHFEDCSDPSEYFYCDYYPGQTFTLNNYDNLIYNNSFHADISMNWIGSGDNDWNVAPTLGTNIHGGPYIAGNLWTNDSGTGFSETCTNTDDDRLCDDPFVFGTGNIDQYPLAYFLNVDGVPVEVIHLDGEEYEAEIVENLDGSRTLIVTETSGEGNVFTVDFPEGVEPQSGDDSIIVEVVGGNKPAIRINADLPDGATKDVVLDRGVGQHVCVNDKSDAEFIAAPGGCNADQVKLPADGTCKWATVEGDPGDNGHPDGEHDVYICLSADGLTVSVDFLLHSVVTVGDDGDGDGVPDDLDLLCPNTDLNGPIPLSGSLRPGHIGDSEVVLGCNPSEILECKPGQNNGAKKHGLSPGLQEAFYYGTANWAVECYPDLSLPICSTNGDMDGDGVDDDDDSNPTDDPQASSTGLEDPETGEADGIPECRPSI